MNSRSTKIRIATRASKLALWQAHFVAGQLGSKGYDHEIIPLTTQGDIILDHPLHDIGGKGLFIKELETALLASRADIAVHSLKDLPVQMGDDFVLGAILPRDSARDMIIFHPDFAHRAKIKAGELTKDDLRSFGKMTIATSSLRRGALLKQYLPTVQVIPIRGNIDTRIRKRLENDWDGLILAEAGITRLGLEDTVIHRPLASNFFIPSPAQGALAVELCKQSPHLAIINQLACPTTTALVTEERMLLSMLGGDCTQPIGCVVQVEQNNTLVARAFAFDPRCRLLSVELSIANWQLASHHLGEVANSLFRQLVDAGWQPLHEG